MALIKNLYIRLYFIVMMLYVFLNKGVAYSFLVELLWASGIILLLLNRKTLEIPNTRQVKILFFFLAFSIIYILKGFISYPFIDVIRDSFIFQYGWLVFILFLFQHEQKFIWDRLFKIYTWFPIVGFFVFLAQFFVPSLSEFKLFGTIPLVLYKYGDMGVHLLISCVLLLMHGEKISTKKLWVLTLFIALDFLIIAAYSRSGALSFIIGVLCFIYFNKDMVLKTRTKFVLKWLPLVLLIVIPFYVSLQVNENFQGRNIGFEQIKDNFGSIIGAGVNVNSENNVTWRLVWWAKIIDNGFTTQGFFIGRGLGMSLAEADGISSLDDELRSPHNFHLNIMARFGVILFFVWMYWMYLLIKPIFKRKIGTLTLAISCILMAFLLNASFDVFLEGPMGAFPFWTWVGLLFITDAQT
ncbi:MAG: hypothetical protein RLZ95_518 [Bacteroidota bacterium]